MYLNYWNIKRFPFNNVADTSFFYLSQYHEEALSRLLYASKMMKGGAMLTGSIGCGKTLISKVYMSKLLEEGCDVYLLLNPPAGPAELLEQILYGMDIDNIPDSKSKALHILNEKIVKNKKNNIETIVIIDESQMLNDETFEEARLLLNLQSNDSFLLTLVLIGQAELKVKIRQIKQFDQRIAIRYHLRPFDFSNTLKYIMHREKKAGFKKNVFTTKSIKNIYEYSQGVPRKINTICDLCLLVGYNQNRNFIDSPIVKSVLKELEDI